MANLKRYNISEASSLSKPLNLQDLIVNPTTSSQTLTYNAGLGYNGLNTVTINPVTAAIDENIKPENIVKGVSILGVTGTSAGAAKLASIYDFRRDGDDLITSLKSEPERIQNFELYVNGSLYKTYDLENLGYQEQSWDLGKAYAYMQFVPKINLLELLNDGSYSIKGRVIGTINPSDFTEEISYGCYTVTSNLENIHNSRSTTFKQNTDSVYKDTFKVGDPALNLSYDLTNPEWEISSGWDPKFIDKEGFYGLADEHLGESYVAVAKVNLYCSTDQNLKIKYRVDSYLDGPSGDRRVWTWTNKYVGFGFGALDINPTFPRNDSWGIDPNFQENRDSYVFTTTDVQEIYVDKEDPEYGSLSYAAFNFDGGSEEFYYNKEYEVDYGTVSAGQHFFYIVFYKDQNWGNDQNYIWDFKFQIQQSYSYNGYSLPTSIQVIVDGVETTNYSYNSSTGELSIPLAGTTVVNASAVKD